MAVVVSAVVIRSTFCGILVDGAVVIVVVEAAGRVALLEVDHTSGSDAGD